MVSSAKNGSKDRFCERVPTRWSPSSVNARVSTSTKVSSSSKAATSRPDVSTTVIAAWAVPRPGSPSSDWSVLKNASRDESGLHARSSTNRSGRYSCSNTSRPVARSHTRTGVATGQHRPSKAAIATDRPSGLTSSEVTARPLPGSTPASGGGSASPSPRVRTSSKVRASHTVTPPAALPATRCRPSGVYRTSFSASAAAGRLATSASPMMPASQTMVDRFSTSPVTTRSPPGENAAPATPLRVSWAESVNISSASSPATRHTRAVPSSAAVTSEAESSLQAMSLTASRWAVTVRRRRPVTAS